MTKFVKDRPAKGRFDVGQRLWVAVLFIAHVATIVVFAMQDKRVLWVLAGVFIVDVACQIVSKFVLSNS